MLDYLSAEQYQDWKEYENRIGPLDVSRHDVNFGIIASLVHNANSKRSRPPKDFMPFWHEALPEEDELVSKIRSVFSEIKSSHN